MPTESAHSSALQTGDLVRLDFELWAEGGGRTELVDTTREEVAQKEEIPNVESHTWGPRPHQIGGDYFPSGIENALLALKVGEEVETEFSPADAFGERDPKLIELYSMHEISRLPEMRREDAHLDVGTVLTIEGRRGRVVTLTQARVRVDFNPPFAGRKVHGKFKVIEKVTEPLDQVRAIVDLQYGRSGEFHVEMHEKVITLRIPERSKFDIGWMAAKPRVIDRLRSQLHPHSIRVVEEYVTPAKAEETGAKSAGGEEEHPAKPASHEHKAPKASAKPEKPKAADATTE
jgi:FKBP-type peptidyl-prolyl cis-trans isomerase 2